MVDGFVVVDVLVVVELVFDSGDEPGGGVADGLAFEVEGGLVDGEVGEAEGDALGEVVLGVGPFGEVGGGGFGGVERDAGCADEEMVVAGIFEILAEDLAAA